LAKKLPKVKKIPKAKGGAGSDKKVHIHTPLSCWSSQRLACTSFHVPIAYETHLVHV
jgi:hypothetical protein